MLHAKTRAALFLRFQQAWVNRFTACLCRQILIAPFLLIVVSLGTSIANAAPLTLPVPERDLSESLEVLATADKSTPSAKLSASWEEVAGCTPSQLSLILEAMDAANPVGANWLNLALDAVLQRVTETEQEPVVELLASTVADISKSKVTRKSALDQLLRLQPAVAENMYPELVNDAVPEFRRPGVARLIESARQLTEEQGDEAEQVAAYQTALQVARDADQVRTIATALEELGQPVLLADHFGFVRDWYVVGPFPNEDGEGFAEVYPPESLSPEEFETLTADQDAFAYDGKSDLVRWSAFESDENGGNVDLNKAIAPEPSGVGYGAAVVQVEEASEVQLRLRIQNAFKIWLNGELLMEQPIGHTGNSFDQYRVDAMLRPGKNLLVVKSCQVEPPQELDFFKVWQFAVRVTDETGAAYPMTQPE